MTDDRPPAATVLVTDYAWPSLDIEREVLRAAGATVIAAATGDEAELVALASEVDAILTCWKPVTPAVLDAAPRCRIVGRYGIGLDNIAVAHATRLGILVTNVPDFCVEEVSDHAMALLLACARRVVGFARATRAGGWESRAASTLPRLRGQVLGLIGCGAIARALVPKALGFGLQVMAFTPRLAPDALAPFGVATNDLDRVLQAADYLSIHAPLTAETRGLLNERAFRLMKPTAYLINTSRGPIVDEAALARALTEGWIAGAALDVLGQEPPEAGNTLLGLDNAIVTPHVAFGSDASIADLRTRAAAQVGQVLRGEWPPHVVNPEVVQRDTYRSTARGEPPADRHGGKGEGGARA
jgi:D-3-phosphoglycerate dehydrogenase